MKKSLPKSKKALPVPLLLFLFPFIAAGIFFVAKRFVYAMDFDLFAQTQHFDSIVLSTDGPASNPKVAAKNPAAQYGISIVKLNNVSGYLPNYSLADLRDIHFDYQLKSGDLTQDAIEIHFYSDIDGYTVKHVVRTNLSNLMGADTTDGWVTTPNAVDSQSNHLIWKEITYPVEPVTESWWQISSRYPNSRIDAVVLSLENPYSDYYFDNLAVNNDIWQVPDFLPTPTSAPTPTTDPGSQTTPTGSPDPTGGDPGSTVTPSLSPTSSPSPTVTPEPLLTKEAVLVAKGVDGKGIYWAPGLNKLIPNENFAGYIKSAEK